MLAFSALINEYSLGKFATLMLQSAQWLRRCTAERKWLMTNEEMQHTMSFILEQQAQSSTKINSLIETQKRTDEGIRALLSIAEIHEREINTIGHQVSSLSQEIRNVGSEISNLSETTRATDERLNTLINVVERQISEGRNGKL
jgi:predicted  nucleic acid-binding Zn-ribbon protein